MFTFGEHGAHCDKLNFIRISFVKHSLGIHDFVGGPGFKGVLEFLDKIAAKHRR